MEIEYFTFHCGVQQVIVVRILCYASDYCCYSRFDPVAKLSAKGKYMYGMSNMQHLD